MNRTISNALWLLVVALPMMAQDFKSNFETMLVEINRSRYDRALTQLFPVQFALREKLEGKAPKLDAGLQARMRQMADPTAVLSSIAVLQTQIEARQYEDAAAQAMLIGFGLSGLWNEMPAYRRMDFYKADLDEAPAQQREMALRRYGYAAAEASEWEAVRKTAQELIRLSDNKTTRTIDAGAIRHSGLTLRGLAELGSGDTAAAEKTLLESMRVTSGLSIRDNGPSFRLAIALLDKGRRQAVDHFLVLVESSPWKQASKAAEWRKQVVAGEIPDFPRYGVN